MTTSERLDRDLTQALTALASPAYPDYFDDALERATARRQRARWAFPERWLPMQVTAQRVAAPMWFPVRRLVLLALIALLVAALAVVGLSASRRLPPPFGVAENGEIVYSDRGDIFARASEMADPRLLVGGPETDLTPIFSRDGTQFAFVRLADHDSEAASLLVADADGSHVRNVLATSDPTSWDWSPSGREAAVVVVDDRKPSLRIVTVDSHPQVRTIDLASFKPVSAGWRAPAGDELIVTGTLDGRWTVLRVDPGTGTYRTIASGELADPLATSLSPDGRWAAVTIFTGLAAWPLIVQLIDLDSGDHHRFGAELPQLPPPTDPFATAVSEGFPTWSPDARRITFGRYFDEHDAHVNHQLWVASIDLDGADAVPLGGVYRGESGNDPFAYAFSPDGTKVLVLVGDVGQMLVGPAGGGQTTPMPWSANDLPTWQRVAP